MNSDFLIKLATSNPAFAKMRETSLHRRDSLMRELDSLGLQTKRVSCIYAVGSLGRLEISPVSDLDGVVVMDNGACDKDYETAITEAENAYGRLGFVVAKSGGIYRMPVGEAALVGHATRGSLSESPEIYGKRIQLILDARPVFRPAAFDRLQQQVVDWFLPTLKGAVDYEFIVNEIQRYSHSYASWQFFKFEKTIDDGWNLRQAKFRTTRLATFAATTLLIGLSSHTQDCRHLRENLSLTPLERIFLVLDYYAEAALAERFLSLYSEAALLLADESVRAALVASSPTSLAEVSPTKSPQQFQRIMQISAEMLDILSGFVFDRRGQWPNRLLRCLIF